MDLSGKPKRALAGLSICALGAGLVTIPVLDMYEDVTVGGKPIYSTIIENSIGLFLALLLVAGGFWIASRDWEFRYVRRMIVWTWGIAAGFGFVFAWVLGIQIGIQGEYKPIIIALDAILLGSVVAFGVGIFDVRREQGKQRADREQSRAAALFENTADDVAALRVSPERVVTLSTNSVFDNNFDDATAVFEQVIQAAGMESRTAFIEYITAGEPFEVEVTLDDRGEQRDFIAQVTPYDETGDNTAELFLVLTDVTEQKQLARERVARSRIEQLHQSASEMANAPDTDEAFDLAMSAAEQSLHFDSAVLHIGGEPVRTHGTDGLLDQGAADDVVTERRPLVARDGGSTVTRRDDEEILTIPIGGQGVLQAGKRDGSFEESQIRAGELLTTHLRETLRRLERERTIREERERMEFLNRILRHDLLNGMNVVRMQGQFLESSVDDDQRERVDTIIDRVDSMTDLINTMRSFMKAVIEGNEHELFATPLDEELTDAVEAARDAHPGATFEVDSVFPPVEVLADGLISELFHNLLTNAVEHNDAAEPLVRIDAETIPDSVLVRIADNGPGIPEGMRSRILEKGEKGEESEGTGLGLYLCEEIISTYGGEMRVNESELGGSEFELELPRATAEE